MLGSYPRTLNPPACVVKQPDRRPMHCNRQIGRSRTGFVVANASNRQGPDHAIRYRRMPDTPNMHDYPMAARTGPAGPKVACFGNPSYENQTSLSDPTGYETGRFRLQTRG